MTLTLRTNGSAGANIITAAWFNDYYNLLTGVMTDQAVTLGNNLSVVGTSSRDNGNILTDGAGIETLKGLICNGAIKPNPTSVVVNGSVSGSVTLYQYFTGSVKRILAYFNNYKSAAAQSLTLPVAFTGISYWVTNELQGGTVEGLLSSTAQTFSVVTAIAIGGGTQNPQTYLKSWSSGGLRAAFDTLRVTVTATACTGLLLIEGI